MNSDRGMPCGKSNFDYPDDERRKIARSHPDRVDRSGAGDQPALSLFPKALMEAGCRRSQPRTGVASGEGNRGAPGPDGMTITQFAEWVRPRWPRFGNSSWMARIGPPGASKGHPQTRWR